MSGVFRVRSAAIVDFPQPDLPNSTPKELAHSKRNIHQDGFLAVIGERNVTQSDITRSWNGLGTRTLEQAYRQVKDLIRRRHTVHGNVEIAPKDA